MGPYMTLIPLKVAMVLYEVAEKVAEEEGNEEEEGMGSVRAQA